MAIDVACKCGAKFRVDDKWAGRRAKCTKCGSVVNFPAKSAPAPLPDLTNNDPLGLNSQPAASPSSNSFSDLFEEDIPVASTSPAGSAGRTALSSDDVRISVEFDVRISTQEEVAQLLRENLLRHFLSAAAGAYSQVELEVHVLAWNDIGAKKVLALSFFGNVNGKRISKNFKIDTAGAGAKVNAATKLWDSAAEAIRGAKVSQQMAQHIEDMVDNACVHIDRVAGKKTPSSAKLWEVFEIVKFVAMAAAFLLTIGVLLAMGGLEDFGPCLLMALVAAAAIFIPIHVVQILSMPGSFYTQDPRGRRVLSRWKVKSVAALKTRLFVMVAISGMAIVGFWVLISSALNEESGGEKPVADSNRQTRIITNVKKPPPDKMSQMVGGPGGKEHILGGKSYVDMGHPTRGSLVRGIEYGVGEWDGKKTLRPFVERYGRNQRRLSMPTEIAMAKDGYAVGGIVVDAGIVVHAVQLIFMRVTDDRQLDPNDSYKSDWLGHRSDATPVEINGGGRRVIGFIIRKQAALDAIGLIYE